MIGQQCQLPAASQLNDKAEGVPVESSVRHSFIVIEKLGQTLQHYFYLRKKSFTVKTVCQLGCRLLQILQKVHQIGLIYNDLKLDNIIVGDADDSPESLS